MIRSFICFYFFFFFFYCLILIPVRQYTFYFISFLECQQGCILNYHFFLFTSILFVFFCISIFFFVRLYRAIRADLFFLLCCSVRFIRSTENDLFVFRLVIGLMIDFEDWIDSFLFTMCGNIWWKSVKSKVIHWRTDSVTKHKSGHVKRAIGESNLFRKYFNIFLFVCSSFE